MSKTVKVFLPACTVCMYVYIYTTIFIHSTTTFILISAAPVKAPSTMESNPADKKMIESLRENVAKLSKQLETSDGKKTQCEEECNKLKKEIINANVKLEMLNKKVSSIGIASADSEQYLKEFVDVRT